MALKVPFIWLCLVGALALSSGHVSDQQEESQCTGSEQPTATLVQSLRNMTVLLEKQQQNGLSRDNATDQQEAPECKWSPQQIATVQQSMRTLADLLYKEELKECQGAKPVNCPDAEVPVHGGLACVTMNDKRYCKPMCNYGYDFGFLRKSRLFEECSQESRYKWSTQYIGGNKLAVCNRESIQVSGNASAYFPKDRDCLTTKSQDLESFLQEMITDLRSRGVDGKPEKACLLCGRP